MAVSPTPEIKAIAYLERHNSQWEFPEIQTDGGHRAIIYSTNAGGNQPIHGAWFCELKEGWLITAWYKDGKRTHLREVSALDITRAIDANQIKI